MRKPSTIIPRFLMLITCFPLAITGLLSTSATAQDYGIVILHGRVIDRNQIWMLFATLALPVA
jgi:hypothetical protein